MLNKSQHNALVLTSSSLVSDHVVDAWLRAGHRIVAVWTQDPDQLRTRTESLLCAYAAGVRPIGLNIRRNRIPVSPINSLRAMPGLIDCVRETGADTLITAMTGLIVPKDVLAHFGGRAINVHPTMLPHYKGPVARSAMMLDGKAEEYGGVTIHALSEGIDEGPIISQRRLPWSDSGGYVEWDYAAARAAGAMIQADVMRYLDGELEAAAQDPAAGNYRRAARNEFSLSVDKPLSIVKSMFARAPGFVFPFRPDYPGLRDVYFVTQLGAVLGKPSGKSPIVGRFSIETDILDARIRLVRKGIYHRTVGHPALKILASRLTNLLPKASVE